MGMREWLGLGSAEVEDKISQKDLLDFMAEQNANTSMLVKSLLDSSKVQAETLKTYIELFKPQTIASSTPLEREKMRDPNIAEDYEWEPMDMQKLLKELGDDR